VAERDPNPRVKFPKKKNGADRPRCRGEGGEKTRCPGFLHQWKEVTEKKNQLYDGKDRRKDEVRASKNRTKTRGKNELRMNNLREERKAQRKRLRDEFTCLEKGKTSQSYHLGSCKKKGPRSVLPVKLEEKPRKKARWPVT